MMKTNETGLFNFRYDGIQLLNHPDWRNKQWELNGRRGAEKQEAKTIKRVGVVLHKPAAILP